jgi:hypothetical protein
MRERPRIPRQAPLSAAQVAVAILGALVVLGLLSVAVLLWNMLARFVGWMWA